MRIADFNLRPPLPKVKISVSHQDEARAAVADPKGLDAQYQVLCLEDDKDVVIPPPPATEQPFGLFAGRRPADAALRAFWAGSIAVRCHEQKARYRDRSGCVGGHRIYLLLLPGDQDPAAAVCAVRHAGELTDPGTTPLTSRGAPLPRYPPRSSQLREQSLRTTYSQITSTPSLDRRGVL